VAWPEEPAGTELQLALNNNPAAKAYQQAIFQQGQPAATFFTDDVKGDYERINARGAKFTMPPTDVTYATIAMLNDTCGNLPLGKHRFERSFAPRLRNGVRRTFRSAQDEAKCANHPDWNGDGGNSRCAPSRCG
jgi:hypothetical protein